VLRDGYCKASIADGYCKALLASRTPLGLVGCVAPSTRASCGRACKGWLDEGRSESLPSLGPADLDCGTLSHGP
jgi:hypothetical protein